MRDSRRGFDAVCSSDEAMLLFKEKVTVNAVIMHDDKIRTRRNPVPTDTVVTPLRNTFNDYLLH